MDILILRISKISFIIGKYIAKQNFKSACQQHILRKKIKKSTTPKVVTTDVIKSYHMLCFRRL